MPDSTSSSPSLSGLQRPSAYPGSIFAQSHESQRRVGSDGRRSLHISVSPGGIKTVKQARAALDYDTSKEKEATCDLAATCPQILSERQAKAVLKAVGGLGKTELDRMREQHLKTIAARPLVAPTPSSPFAIGARPKAVPRDGGPVALPLPSDAPIVVSASPVLRRALGPRPTPSAPTPLKMPAVTLPPGYGTAEQTAYAEDMINTAFFDHRPAVPPDGNRADPIPARPGFSRPLVAYRESTGEDGVMRPLISFGTMGTSDADRERFVRALIAAQPEGENALRRAQVSLPFEGTAESRAAMALRIGTLFLSLDLPFYITAHDPIGTNDPRNFHLHIAYSERPARRGLDGRWDFEIEEPRPRTSPKGAEFARKVGRSKMHRPWMAKGKTKGTDFIRDLRAWCEEAINDETERFATGGVLVSAKSNRDRGLTTEPTLPLGPGPARLKMQGIWTKQAQRNRDLEDQDRVARAGEGHYEPESRKATAALLDRTRLILDEHPDLPEALRLEGLLCRRQVAAEDYRTLSVEHETSVVLLKNLRMEVARISGRAKWEAEAAMTTNGEEKKEKRKAKAQRILADLDLRDAQISERKSEIAEFLLVKKTENHRVRRTLTRMEKKEAIFDAEIAALAEKVEKEVAERVASGFVLTPEQRAARVEQDSLAAFGLDEDPVIAEVAPKERARRLAPEEAARVEKAKVVEGRILEALEIERLDAEFAWTMTHSKMVVAGMISTDPFLVELPTEERRALAGHSEEAVAEVAAPTGASVAVGIDAVDLSAEDAVRALAVGPSKEAPEIEVDVESEETDGSSRAPSALSAFLRGGDKAEPQTSKVAATPSEPSLDGVARSAPSQGAARKPSGASPEVLRKRFKELSGPLSVLVRQKGQTDARYAEAMDEVSNSDLQRALQRASEARVVAVEAGMERNTKILDDLIAACGQAALRRGLDLRTGEHRRGPHVVLATFNRHAGIGGPSMGVARAAPAARPARSSRVEPDSLRTRYLALVHASKGYTPLGNRDPISHLSILDQMSSPDLDLSQMLTDAVLKGASDLLREARSNPDLAAEAPFFEGETKDLRKAMENHDQAALRRGIDLTTGKRLPEGAPGIVSTIRLRHLGGPITHDQRRQAEEKRRQATIAKRDGFATDDKENER